MYGRSLLGKSIVALGLRFGALGGKYLLLLVMVRHGALGDVAMFGFIQGGSVIYSKLAGVGLGLGIARRPTLGSDRVFGRLLEYCLRAFFLIYVLSAVVAVFIGIAAPWNWLPLCLGLVICVLDHLTFELAQMGVARGQVAFFLLINFIRTGLWCFVASAVLICFDKAPVLDLVLFVWLLGLILAAIVGFNFFRVRLGRLIMIPSRHWTRWYRIHSIASIPAFGASVAVALIAYSDRFILGFMTDMNVVGTFVFLCSMGFALETILVGSIVQISTSELIGAYRAGMREFVDVVMLLLRRAMWWSLGCGFIMFAVLRLFIHIIAPQVVASGLVLALIVVAYVLRTLGGLFYLSCYAAGWFVVPALAGCIYVMVTSGFMFVLVGPYGLLGASVSVVAGSLVTLIVYSIGFIYYVKLASGFESVRP